MNSAKLSANRLVIGLVGIGIAIALFIVLDMGSDIEMSTDAKLASYIFFKASIGKIEEFKDESILHGPTYFYFQTNEDDILRIVEWLELKPREKQPSLFTELIINAKSQVSWDFDWYTKHVFVIYYCNASGFDWGFDMLLVDGKNVVYVTSGFIHASSRLVENLDECKG